MEAIKMNVVHWEVSNLSETAMEPAIQSFSDNNGLTPREREVLRILLFLGLRNDDLSSVLFISSKTVKHHLASTMEKTRTRSSRELQALFLRFVMMGTPAVQ
jgi:DNA-binding CsgD family transcriptional regulator